MNIIDKIDESTLPNSLDRLNESTSLNSVLQDLVLSFVSQRFLSSRVDIQFESIKKAGWICSILADSENEAHKAKAQAFAILLHLYGRERVHQEGKTREDYDRLSYVILSRLGNLLSTKFLTSLFSDGLATPNNFKLEFGQLLNIEVIKSRQDRIIISGQTPVLTTDFQLDLWNKLESTNNVAISAPTSAGKSFVIQSYIRDYFIFNDFAHALYIVPTKALINQVSDDLRHSLPRNTQIRATFVENNILQDAEGNLLYYNTPEGRIIYILTPERCLKLLQYFKSNSFYPNVIFVDEIQGVEETEGRGALLEFVLESIALNFSKSKIITAGPFIKNNAEVFNELFNLTVDACTTVLPPVFQLRTIINSAKSKGTELIIIDSFRKFATQFVIDTDFNFQTEIKQQGKGVAVAKLVKLIAIKAGEQSIVYCSQSNWAENWALKLEELTDSNNVESDTPTELTELIEFISNEIHPKYYLIRCLRKNVAFHHGKLPDVVRKSVEDLFKNGSIRTIYCTSTLLQGVNLPAQNLFVTSPSKRDIPLTPFEFGNLIGRAGRISDSIYGVIYCIENEDKTKQWAQNLYDSPFEKDVISATRRVLENPSLLLDSIDKPSIDISERRIASALITLRQHYISGPENFSRYLSLKKLNQEDILKLITPIASSLSTITIPTEILRLNPSIDPLLQDRLYKAIEKEGIEYWVIHYNKANFKRRIKKGDAERYNLQELSFYWQFARLCEKLNGLFRISFESKNSFQIDMSIMSIAHFGYIWLVGTPLKDIINDDIKYQSERLKMIDSSNENDINKIIKRIINIHSQVVTFQLVKYFKLLADILHHLMTEEQVINYKFTLSLPLMLELGTTEPHVIQLISAGITRSVALQVFREFEKSQAYNQVDILAWLSNENNLIDVSKIFIRYLKKLEFISN